jgi:hypothetical protein
MTDDATALALQRNVLLTLAGKLAPEGFKAVAARQALTRRRPPGEHVIHVAFIRHAADLDVTIQVAVRLDKLRPVYRAAQLGVEPMLGAELGNMVDGRPRRWTVAAPPDLDAVGDSIQALCRTFALPWFVETADLTAVYGWLRGDDRRAWLLAPVPMYRGYLLVALAGVIDSPRAASEVADQYAAALVARRDAQAEQFARRVPALLSALAGQL